MSPVLCYRNLRGNETRLRADTCMLMMHGLKYGISGNCSLEDLCSTYEPHGLHINGSEGASSYIYTSKQSTSVGYLHLYLVFKVETESSVCISVELRRVMLRV